MVPSEIVTSLTNAELSVQPVGAGVDGAPPGADVGDTAGGAGGFAGMVGVAA